VFVVLISGARAVGGSRNLFTLEAVGVEAYEKQRTRTQVQFTGMVDKFRDKMREFTLSESKNMIFTEDLKNMVHLIENRPDDLTLIHQMMKRYEL
jgi:pentatricopeptide repeat domain-containing protein 2